jgi:SAM-dependent methyltransferase
MPESDFPRLFQAQYCSFRDDLPLWLSLAEQQGSPILELGCGPGRVLQFLAGAGFEVYGIDHDHAMLVRARASLLPFLQSKAHLVQADITSLELETRFPLIISPCNTLALFPPEDLAALFVRLHRQLSPGGVLAFELPTPASKGGDTLEGEPLTAFIEPETGHPVQLSVRQVSIDDPSAVDITWCYDELRPDGTVNRLEVPTRLYLYEPFEIEAMLRRTGYAAIGCAGDYQGAAWDSQVEQMIVTAQAIAR